MMTLIKQEVYKYAHQKSAWINTLIAFGLAVGMGILMHLMHQPNAEVLASYLRKFGSVDGFVAIMMVIIASNIFGNEYQSGSIKVLLSRQYSRIAVFFSKVLTLALIHIELLLAAFVGTMMTKVVFFNDVKGAVIDKQELSLQFLNYWPYIVAAIFLSVLLRKGSIAVAVGVAGIGTSQAVTALLITGIHKFEWLKWIPLNFVNAGVFASMPAKAVSSMTGFTYNQLVTGNIALTLLVLILAVLIFNRQKI